MMMRQYFKGPVRSKEVFFWRQASTAPFERWYCPPILTNPTLTSVTLTSSAASALNTLYALPFPVPSGGVVDRIGFNLLTLATVSGAKARLGIYRTASASTLYPSSLVLDSGDFIVDSTGTTGVNAATVSQYLDPDALYWLVMLFGVGNTTEAWRGTTVTNLFPIFGIDPALGTTRGYGLSVAQTYGALPATFPAGGSVMSSGSSIPLPFVRFSA